MRNVLEAFNEYVEQYNKSDVKIYLKYVHTEKVAEYCERIANWLGLSEEEIMLAWKIGVLHDIGRFEQVKRYNTFKDALSVNHAQFGADLLFEEGLIRRFEANEELYELIEKAIRYHNCYELPEGLTEKELLFCNILRDADKIDIFRVNVETGMEAIYNVTTQELKTSCVTPEVLAECLKGRTIPRHLHRTVADDLLGHIALWFGLKYNISKEIVKEQGYLEQLLTFPTENEETRHALEKVREVIKI